MALFKMLINPLWKMLLVNVKIVILYNQSNQLNLSKQQKLTLVLTAIQLSKENNPKSNSFNPRYNPY
jgi:hypothetical protein